MPKQQVAARKRSILEAAIRIASKPGGWVRLTRVAIATEASCSQALVSHYLGSVAQIQVTVIRAAIKRENYDLLIQAVAAGHPEAQKIRAKTLAHLTSGV
jgi:AcrR family transcriptional regulator